MEGTMDERKTRRPQTRRGGVEAHPPGGGLPGRLRRGAAEGGRLMAPQERRRRALDRGLFLADRVARVASATWLVPSQTDPGGVHAVALIDGHLRCDCFAAL